MLKLIIFSAAVLSFSSESEAFPSYLGNFADHYDFNDLDTTDLQAEESCGLCHVNVRGGGRRNNYGNDFISAVRSGGGFAEIEMFDSDDDGFSNLEEIFFNSAPGRSESSPNSRIKIEETSTGLLLSFEGCANINLKSFGVTLGLDGTAPSFASQSVNVEGLSSLTLTKSAQGGVVLASCGNSAGSFGL